MTRKWIAHDSSNFGLNGPPVVSDTADTAIVFDPWRMAAPVSPRRPRLGAGDGMVFMCWVSEIPLFSGALMGYIRDITGISGNGYTIQLSPRDLHRIEDRTFSLAITYSLGL